MLRGLRVLVVEDELLVGYDIIGCLEDFDGIAAGLAHGVSEALAMLRSQQIDRAIVDYKLLDGDAQPLLNELRDLGIPTVVLTGSGALSILKEAFPGLLILAKPMHPIQVFRHLLSVGPMVRARGDQASATALAEAY